jgi:hypothetical protein
MDGMTIEEIRRFWAEFAFAKGTRLTYITRPTGLPDGVMVAQQILDLFV